MNFSNQENDENLAFSQTFQFLPDFRFFYILDYSKIRTMTNFENPNGKSLDLYLIM